MTNLTAEEKKRPYVICTGTDAERSMNEAVIEAVKTFYLVTHAHMRLVEISSMTEEEYGTDELAWIRGSGHCGAVRTHAIIMDGWVREYQNGESGTLDRVKLAVEFFRKGWSTLNDRNMGAETAKRMAEEARLANQHVIRCKDAYLDETANNPQGGFIRLVNKRRAPPGHPAYWMGFHRRKASVFPTWEAAATFAEQHLRPLVQEKHSRSWDWIDCFEIRKANP
jgi:hypothetical protein